MRMAGGRTASPHWARSGIGFVDDLAAHGDAPALIEDDRVVTHAELDRLVDIAAGELGSGRRLVLVPLAARVESVVAYLGCLRAGHVALVCPDDAGTVARLVERFDPDTVVDLGLDGSAHRRESPRHALHPDLAALSSTSGSTGSPKLVRLSKTNLDSNAAAIAAALHLSPTDRAITSLPLHYCYGQSVLHSHLAVGGAVILTATSVVDDCFWAAVDRHQVTTLAGVPHSFELLDRSTVALADHPSLRLLTQAGGRMRPELVRSMAARAAAHDVDFRVMYGQTEATARIAITPPGVAIERPSVVGRPIPGSEVRVDPVGDLEDPTAGELVVRGPGVMMGYATSPADLERGREIDELRTGDLARVDADGIIEIVGRRADFVKLFGLRIDLGRVGDMLAAEGIDAQVDGDDDGLVLALPPGHDPGSAAPDLARRLGLPRKAVVAAALTELPRLANGKVDRAGMRREVRLLAPDRASGGDDGAVAEVFAAVLGIDRVRADDTFVALGGDSLSYVEASVRLERLLGTLPDRWHHRTVSDLEEARVAPTRWARVDSNVVLRAIAIVLILANHTGAFLIGGGAHVLLAGAGYNLARFQLANGAPWRSILRLALPATAWIGAVAATTDDFDLAHALLLHGWIGGPGRWSYWFVEVLAQLLVVTALALSVPAVRRLERSRPFALPVALTAVALLVRFDLLELGDHHRPFFRPHEVAWIFLLGWTAQRADGPGRRALVSAVALASVPGYFGSPTRDLVLLVGILAMTWITRVPVPRSITSVVGALAGASLWIYLTHFQVHPVLSPERPWLAMGLSVAVGIAAWRLLDPGLVRLGDRISRRVGRAVRRASAALPRQRSGGRDTVGA